ncbi:MULTISPECIES: FAD synthetase family protein [unclassified Nocardioides]|uniref:FAD synthetase family protein n=1 Tax=unclassified Nocardioides TaxID=2615069 RepID=UPI0013FD9F2D|nr:MULTISPECIES: FAD synthetase family protein [unclassified Nocardioides]
MRPAVTFITDANARHARSRVAIGFFDGVHLGHRAVIEGCSTVLTFDRHPLAVLAPAAVPELLMSLEERVAALGAIGVEEVVLIPFDHTWAGQAAEDFVADAVLGVLKPEAVSVGRNFRFGAHAAGNPETLRTVGGLPTVVADLTTVDGAVVSSSRIRSLISHGDVDAAARLMGHPLEHTATRLVDGVFEVPNGLAMPPAGTYLGVVDGQTGAIVVGPGGRQFRTAVPTTADRVDVGFLSSVD